MRLALDARAGERPHSSYARVLELLRQSAAAADLPAEMWSGGTCSADALWCPHLDLPRVDGPRIVGTLHDVNPLLPDGRGMLARMRREVRFQRMVRKGGKVAWRVATDSENALADIARHFPELAGKTRVVPLFADPSLHAGAADPNVLARHGLQAGYVLHVGALRRHKNWEALLRAFARLPAPLRKAHPLVLAGDARRAGRNLPKLVSSLMLEGEVRELGVVSGDELPHLYRGAALFVFPSLLEGFGLPPLEAMASGVPVAASRASCLPEVLGAAPEYFDPNSPAELAAVMERVLGQPELADALRQRGLEQAATYNALRTGTAMRRLLGLV